VTSDETRIAGFFAKYEPATAKLGKALRAKLRDRLPGLFELVYVYERQESLVFSYSPSENGAAGVCALALYPGQVKLFFTGGDRLSKADPDKLLQGQGKAVRHVVMSSVADYDRAEIEALMAAALKLAKLQLDPSAKITVLIKADEQKERARLRRVSDPSRTAAPARPRRALRAARGRRRAAPAAGAPRPSATHRSA